jgi:quercetin dioxygenase-like cupin family protein
MFTVLGIPLQFVSTPDQNGGNLSVMRSGIPPRAVIPLHSHTDAEIFYVTEGTMEVFQDAEYLRDGKQVKRVKS